MMTITMIEELKRLEAEATQGKWIAAPYSSKVGMPIVASPSGKSVAKITYWKIGPVFENHERESEANAALIVAMRNALPELLKALEEAQELLRRVPSALNGAFMAGTEEREGGSARRQDKYAREGDDLRHEIPEFLNSLPPHGGVDVG